MRVLIADDQKTVGTTLAALVTQCGHDVVEVVGSGLEAIQAYTRHQPDVVLMDYWMPRLNGATACRNILARDRNAKIILVSGAALTPEITEAGAIAILSKPVSLEPLYGALYEAGSPRRQAAKPAPPNELPPDAELPRRASPDEPPRSEAESAGDSELLD